MKNVRTEPYVRVRSAGQFASSICPSPAKTDDSPGGSRVMSVVSVFLHSVGRKKRRALDDLSGVARCELRCEFLTTLRLIFGTLYDTDAQNIA
jgi:hypothetical protein